jgi:hypothetical protein
VTWRGTGTSQRGQGHHGEQGENLGHDRNYRPNYEKDTHATHYDWHMVLPINLRFCVWCIFIILL